MKYLFYAIVYDVAGNATEVGSSASPAKAITTNIQKVTGISINPNSAQTKNIGETFKITATVSPSDANNKAVNWSSSNSSIATVDSSGNVRCLAAGTTSITATTADGSGVKSELSLTVRDPLTSLTLDKPQTTLLYGGATATVTATTTPSDYDANNLTWTIGDTSLATISGSGKTRTITSNNTKKTGETTLTVSGGGKTATMKVSIVNFQTTTYNYTGSVQQVDLPAGTYKLECWGAQGGSGNGTNSQGGLGGYSIGTISLTTDTIVYVVVGEKGKINTSNSGYTGYAYNGGGRGYNNSCGGGGATHFATRDGELKSLGSYKSSVIMVAGGGGGAGFNTTHTDSGYAGGYGGGDEGQSGNSGNDGAKYSASGGTQSSGYAFGSGQDAFTMNGGWSGAGGGGYYGGNAPNIPNGCGSRGGGGGSGYVNTSKLTSAQTIAGNQSFPNVAGTGNETGHSGNGAAKITPVN